MCLRAGCARQVDDVSRHRRARPRACHYRCCYFSLSVSQQLAPHDAWVAPVRTTRVECYLGSIGLRLRTRSPLEQTPTRHLSGGFLQVLCLPCRSVFACLVPQSIFFVDAKDQFDKTPDPKLLSDSIPALILHTRTVKKAESRTTTK